MHTNNKDGFIEFEKLFKALSNLSIFRDGKNLSINQWLSKIES